MPPLVYPNPQTSPVMVCSEDIQVSNLRLQQYIQQSSLRNSELDIKNMSENKMSGFKGFYKNESLSDVVLVFSGRRVPVHRVILPAQNKYLSGFFEESFAEATAQQVELHDDNPEALERLLKCLYGYDPEVFNEYYAESVMRADREEVEPEGGWSDVAIKNCLRSCPIPVVKVKGSYKPWRLDPDTRAWRSSPRCHHALAHTIDLYFIPDKYLAAEVCDALVRRFDFALRHWLFSSTYFRKTGRPEDAMRRNYAGFFDGWWVTSVGAWGRPVTGKLRKLYGALPELHSDVLQLQATRAARKRGE